MVPRVGFEPTRGFNTPSDFKSDASAVPPPGPVVHNPPFTTTLADCEKSTVVIFAVRSPPISLSSSPTARRLLHFPDICASRNQPRAVGLPMQLTLSLVRRARRSRPTNHRLMCVLCRMNRNGRNPPLTPPRRGITESGSPPTEGPGVGSGKRFTLTRSRALALSRNDADGFPLTLTLSPSNGARGLVLDVAGDSLLGG